MFAVHKRGDRGDDRVQEFRPFSHGLVDLVICMVANRRERKYLSLHPEYCPESDPNIFEGPLSRAVLMALRILNAKLVSEHDRIAASIENHPYVTFKPISNSCLSSPKRSAGSSDRAQSLRFGP
jgi:hypothetical protein